MKLNKYLILGAIFGLALTTFSCSEDFLETKPTGYCSDEVVNEILLADLNKFQDILNGAYLEIYCGWNNYAAHDANGMMSIFLVTDLNSEDVAYNRDAHWYKWDYQLDNRGPGYRRTSTMWTQLYYTISATNKVIGTLKAAEPTPEIESMLGQAYGLRAYAYYYLVNLYQHPYKKNPDAKGVPIYTDVATEFVLGRAPVKDIYTLISGDLNKAYALLKEKEFNKLQVNKNVVATLYSNVLLFLGDYAEAAKYADYAKQGVTLSTAEELMGGFEDVNGMNGIIWGEDINAETSYMYASFQSHVCSYSKGYGGAVGFRKLGASALVNKIASNDIRKGWFGFNAAYNTLNVDFSYEVGLGLTPYIQNKFRNPDGQLGGDFIMMRVEEAYFLAAEAYYLAGNEASAKQSLQDVMSIRIPGYTCTLSGDALYQEICWQKRIEMWGEGRRLFDAKRRGETIDRSASTNHALDLPSYDALAPYKADEDKRMIYTIPLKEMENNEYITEEDQNP